MIRARQVGRVALRHLTDLRRDKRTLFALLAIPALTVILMVAVRDEIVGSISGTDAQIEQPIAVEGARYGGEFLDDLRAFANVKVIPTDDVRAAVRDERALVGLVIPKGFSARIREGRQATLGVVQGTTSFRASIAEATLQGAINGFANRVAAERLEAAGLPRDTAQPIKLRPENVATREERSGNVLGQFLPFLVLAQVVALMTGIAVDATAGEKERRTIEALVATPLRRREILIGKWLFTTGVGSLGATITVGSAVMAFRRQSRSLLGADVSTLPDGALESLLLGGIAAAMVIASIQLALGTIARSVQQAAAISSPLFFIVFVPLLLLEGTSGTTVAAARYAIPALGPAMLTKYGLAGTAVPGAMATALVTSAIYALVVLIITDRLFRSERAVMRV